MSKKVLCFASYLTMLALAVCVMMSFYACSSDSEDEEQGNQNVAIFDNEIIPIVNVDIALAVDYTEEDKPETDDMKRIYYIYFDKNYEAMHYLGISVTNNLSGVKRYRNNDFHAYYIDRKNNIYHHFYHPNSNVLRVTDDSYIMIDDHNQNNIEIDINIKYYWENVYHTLNCHYKGPQVPRANILK